MYSITLFVVQRRRRSGARALLAGPGMATARAYAKGAGSEALGQHRTHRSAWKFLGYVENFKPTMAGRANMKTIGIKSGCLLLVALSVACGVDAPYYHSREHTDGAESHLAEALLSNDKKAVAYWLEKSQEPSLALCYLLEIDSKEYGDLKDAQATTKMLDVLFERGASPNVICEHYLDNFSPLSLAVSLERPDIVQYLLARNANPNLYFTHEIEGKKFKPMSTLMLAVSRHGSYYKELGSKFNPVINTEDTYKKGQSLLEKKKSVCLQIVSQLLATNADVNYQGSFTTPIFGASESEDKSALMIAVEYLDREMIDLLLEKGARKDLKDVHGKTADIYAADAGHLDLARELMP